MTLYEGLYRLIKNEMPKTYPIIFGEGDANSENCAIWFNGNTEKQVQDISGNIINRKTRIVINYNTQKIFDGYDYGEDIIRKLINVINVQYIDDETHEHVCYVSKIKLDGNINFTGKNPNNGLNCFSLNFIVTYGKLGGNSNGE